VRRLALPLAVGLLAGTATARTVETGTRVDMMREGRRPPLHMVIVPPRGGDAVQMLGIPHVLEIGETFALLDDHGPVAHLRVDRVEMTEEECPGTRYQRGFGSLSGKQRDFELHDIVAVGPLRDEIPATARRMKVESGTAVSLPPPGRTDSLFSAVDLDGDGGPDLVRYIHACDDITRHAPGMGEICIADWRLEGAGWVQDTQARVVCRR
jgi:hypothetical protein